MSVKYFDMSQSTPEGENLQPKKGIQMSTHQPSLEALLRSAEETEKGEKGEQVSQGEGSTPEVEPFHFGPGFAGPSSEALARSLGQATQPTRGQKEAVLVLFGGTGDLAKRKLLPALYNLDYEALRKGEPLPFRVLAIGRRRWSRQTYLQSIQEWVQKFCRKPIDDELFECFSQAVDYYELDIESAETYDGLFAYLKTYYPEAQLLYYFAVAPRYFTAISKGLGRQPAEAQKARVLIEKPFGENLEQALKLYEKISQLFGAEQVYHIDHYLGKEMIQNIQTLRFDNRLLKHCWNRDCIAAVEITAAEQVGVESRAGYYDQSGAMRDMVQNHLFQILSILAMEEPERDNPYALTVTQQNVLQALRPLDSAELDERLCLAQYRGYKDEEGVSQQSTTDTYAALVLHIDNPRWQGVPFFMRTGKKLANRSTYVVIHFRETMPGTGGNRLVIEIQPTEGVRLSFNIKKPGLSFEVEEVEMNFCQSCQIDAHQNTPEAYERLLSAALQGQRFLFSQWPQISWSWAYVDSLLEAWRRRGKKLASYEVHSQGPEEAEALTKPYGLAWSDINEF